MIDTHVVNQVLIDLIRNDPHVIVEGPLTDRSCFLSVENCPGRVRGRHKQEHFGAGSPGRLQLCDRDFVILVSPGKNFNRDAPGERNYLRVCGPERGGDDDFVAFIQKRLEGLIHSLLATVGNDNLAGINRPAAIAGSLVSDCLFEGR